MHMFGLWEEARHAGTGRKCKVHTERPEDQLINQYVFLKDLLKMHNIQYTNYICYTVN